MPDCGGCKARLETIHSNNLRRFSNERKGIRSERICHCPAAGLRGNSHRACNHHAVCGEFAARLFSRTRTCRVNQRHYLRPARKEVPENRYAVYHPHGLRTVLPVYGQRLCICVLRNSGGCKRTHYAGRRVSEQNPSCHPSCAYMDAQRNGQHADSAAVP